MEVYIVAVSADHLSDPHYWFQFGKMNGSEYYV